MKTVPKGAMDGRITAAPGCIICVSQSLDLNSSIGILYSTSWEANLQGLCFQYSRKVLCALVAFVRSAGDCHGAFGVKPHQCSLRLGIQAPSMNRCISCIGYTIESTKPLSFPSLHY